MPEVLLIDHDPDLLQALSDMIALRLPGTRVDTVTSGREALELVRSKDYDAVVVGLGPTVSALEEPDLVSHVRHLRPRTPALLIAGHDGLGRGRQRRATSAYAYLQKPLDRRGFVDLLRRAIHLRRIYRQCDAQAEEPRPV